ncbi:hypothetical protein CA2015_4415 [Cyclobacterium amurskyense]|uniref:RHS repeat-associated core domain-containing protein n=1 Tax=Cyclobacterium amurskyense TaxID=320787 RepID=A0A0H4PZB0_9BACT|nr:hypothetical protein CA2015_4415 [Cyclobacterium amurskyense]
MSVDPLADHPNQIDKSPYAAFWNNPIYYIDPDGKCPKCPTDEDVANAFATDLLSVKNSFYSLFTRPFGYEATFVENERRDFETGFVETSDGFGTGALKFGLDALNVVTFGRGGGATGGFVAKSGASTPVINNANEILKRFSALDVGPLPEAIAKTFRGASYTENIAQESLTLFREYGGDAGELGGYWSRTKPTGPLQSKIDSALDPSWGNTAERITSITLP